MNGLDWWPCSTKPGGLFWQCGRAVLSQVVYFGSFMALTGSKPCGFMFWRTRRLTSSGTLRTALILSYLLELVSIVGPNFWRTLHGQFKDAFAHM